MTWPNAFKEKPAQGRSSSRPARWTQTAVSTPQPTSRLQKTASARVFLRQVGDAIVRPFLPTKRHGACMPLRRGARCDIRGSTAPTPCSWTKRPQPRWRAVLAHIKHRSTLLLELVGHVKFRKARTGQRAFWALTAVPPCNLRARIESVQTLSAYIGNQPFPVT